MPNAKAETLLGMPIRGQVAIVPDDAFILVTEHEVVLYSGGVIHKLTQQEYAAHVERCWNATIKGDKA